jgi:hypothetical protein
MWISLQFRTEDEEEEEEEVCTRDQTSELTLSRQQPKELAHLDFSNFKKISASTEEESRIARGQLKCDGTRAETRFCLSAKRTSPFKSAGALVLSTTGSRGVRISGSNAGYTKFRGSVKSTDYPLHSPVSPSLPSRASPCATTMQLKSTRDQCDAEGRVLFPASKMFLVSRSTVRPNKVIDVEAETTPNFDPEWRELSG